MPLLVCMNRIGVGVQDETRGEQKPYLNMTPLRDAEASFNPIAAGGATSTKASTGRGGFAAAAGVHI